MISQLKTIALAALLSAGLAGMAAADGPGRGRNTETGRIQARVERMRADLDLTNDQARRIEEILTEAARSRPDRLGGERGERAEGRDRGRMREQRRETFERIQAVLTAEQRQRFEELREERRERQGGRDGRRGARRDRENF